MDTDENGSSGTRSMTVSLTLCDTLAAHGGIQDMTIGMLDSEVVPPLCLVRTFANKEYRLHLSWWLLRDRVKVVASLLFM